jgi:hypothetical protein
MSETMKCKEWGLGKPNGLPEKGGCKMKTSDFKKLKGKLVEINDRGWSRTGVVGEIIKGNVEIGGDWIWIKDIYSFRELEDDNA